MEDPVAPVNEDVALLRAQLVQCTTAMREAVNTLAGDKSGEQLNAARGAAITMLNEARGKAVPDEAWRDTRSWAMAAASFQAKLAAAAIWAGDALDVIDRNIAPVPGSKGDLLHIQAEALNVVRAGLRKIAAAEPAQLERIRAGEWQAAKQETARLNAQLNETKAQLETTQKALLEARENTDFPNQPLEEARKEAKVLFERLEASRATVASLTKQLHETQAGVDKQVATLTEQLAKAKEGVAVGLAAQSKQAKDAAERYEAMRRHAETQAEAHNKAAEVIEQARLAVALLHTIVGDLDA